MPQLLETSSTNWDLDPIYDDYPDDAADVVQAPEAYGVQSDDAAGVVQAPEAYGVQPDDAAGVVQVPEAYRVHPDGVVQAPPEAYGVQPDDLHQVTTTLKEDGLPSIHIIFGIDFNRTNEWKGKRSFDCQSLHATGNTPNPYEKVISVLGKTLVPFSEGNMIPCYGFGDETTKDKKVFSFHNDHSPCRDLQEVLSCYRKILPNVQLSGPTSYAPVVDAAINIVEKSCGQYHILFIITDGQVTRIVNTSDEELSPQEEQTIESIVNASSYPLSIVLVGVGDGPWEVMQKFEKNQKIPERKFNNFQFVNFTDYITERATPYEKETAFATAALMDIPNQYKEAIKLGILGRVTGRAKKIVPRPPPVPYSRPQMPTPQPSRVPSMEADERNQAVCPICLTNAKDLAFGCGHLTCQDCGARVSNCPICRQPIRNRLRVFIG